MHIFLGFVNDNLFFFSFSAKPCHIFHGTYEGKVIKEIVVVLKMDFLAKLVRCRV